MSDHELMKPGWRDRCVTANGVALHVVEAGPEEGRAVILLHGFPEFWWAWREQIQPLADAGFRVIVPDLRGYNLSEAAPGVAAYTLDRLAGDVVALATALAIERFDLVGHDWGGIVAWHVAARHADRVSRLVIMAAPHPDIGLREALADAAQAARSSYVLFFQLPWLPEAMLGAFDFAMLRRKLRASANAGVFDPATLDYYVAAWKRPGRLTAMLNYYRALPLRNARSGRIATPTAILWGEYDSFLGQHLARASQTYCDDAAIDVIAGTTHWLHHEQPDRVTALILRHLDRAPSPAIEQRA